MQPKFDDNQLLCPNCQSWYLHHYQVDVFERWEDATQGLHVKVSGGHLSADENLEGNPSARRHGISIKLWCEDCKKVSILTLAQHKGLTLIEIESTGEDVPDEIYERGWGIQKVNN